MEATLRTIFWAGILLVSLQSICTVDIPSQTDAISAAIPIADNTTSSIATMLGNQGSIGVQETLKSKGNGNNETHSTYVSDTPSLKDIQELSARLGKKQDNTTGNTGSEVADLNKKVTAAQSDLELAKSVFTSTTFQLHGDDIISVGKNDDDVGPIQSNENEDDREAKKDKEEKEEIILDAGPLVTKPIASNAGQIPIIVASMFVILCMIGYTALLMWRRHLERKYGNREMLVNEELDPNDMRHFSI